MMTTWTKRLGWLLLLSSVFIWSCSNDDGGPTGPGPVDHTGSISGIVQGGAKAPIDGALVEVGNLSATTNQDGYFSISSVPAGSALVDITLAGYLSVHRVVDVLEDQNIHLTNIYLPQAESFTVDGAAGGTAMTGDGDGSVIFGANAFEDAAGTPYTGDVTVEVTAMLPEDETFYDAFPGAFEGQRTDGTTVQFVSYGFMGVNLYSTSKAPLQLASGQTATLSLAVSSTFAKQAPATIPMWYFDEATGIWREEGEATLVGERYEAQVSHFTTWNWDLPVTDISQLQGWVHNDQGQPVQNARVFSQGVDFAILDEALTNASGFFSVRALKNAYSDVWAIKGSFASEATRHYVGEASPDTLPDPLVLVEPAFAVTLTWGIAPDDLDSHLLIPMTWDVSYTYYHLYYSNMGTLGDNPYTVLDTDDTDSYGPEIISSSHFYQGTYQYWVNNYTDDTSQGLHDSGALVQLEIGGRLYLYRASDVSLSGADPTGWWHVFNFTVAQGGGITVQPVMQYQPVFSDTGLYEDKSHGRMK
jgi:hypothetical protein